MREPTTFIKLDRNILRWRWFQDPNTMLVWVWLLLNANIEPTDYRDMTIERGEICCTFEKIASETGLTKKCVRTAMDHLLKTGEIRKNGHDPKRPKYIIEGFSRYQGDRAQRGHEEGTQGARNGHEAGTQRAASKEYKEEEEKKKYKKYKKGERAYAREAPTGIAAIDQILAAELAKQEGGGNNDQA